MECRDIARQAAAPDKANAAGAFGYRGGHVIRFAAFQQILQLALGHGIAEEAPDRQRRQHRKMIRAAHRPVGGIGREPRATAYQLIQFRKPGLDR